MKKTISIATAILLFIAIFQWPYSYYIFLRVFVFSASLYLLLVPSKELSRNLKAGIIVTAILFNPFLKIHMPKESWMFFNLIGSIIFIAVFFDYKKIR